MSSDKLHFGHLLAEPLFDVWQVGDARNDEEALPAAMMLTQERFAEHHAIERRDVSADGEAVDRRSLDDRQVTQAGHGHLQRAGDGCRR